MAPLVKESITKMFGINQEENQNIQIQEIKINQIKANPYQPRKFFDPILLEELAKSISEYGIIQPLIVRQSKGKYELVAGERRWRAAQSIGLPSVPVIVKNYNDKDMAEIALIENLQREDLNYFEEAEGYKKLIDEFSLKQEEIAKRMGKRQSTIANKLRLLKLSDEVRKNISVDIITERHARALLKLPDDKMQLNILKEIYERELTVRETDVLVDEILSVNETNVEKKNTGKKIVRIFKDMRIYLNTIKSAVSAIETAGLEVDVKEAEYDDHVQVVINIYKQRRK